MKISSSKERIKELMEYFGINQTELCGKTGLQKSALSNYLNGDREPRQDQISLIVDPFNVNPAWLMGYDVSMFLNIKPAAAESSLDAPVQLRQDETNLLDKYNMLNDLGRSKAYDYVSDLTENEKYIQGLEELNKVG